MGLPKVYDLVDAEVTVAGSKLGGSFTVVSISINHAINKIPTAVITIPDGDPAAQDFPLSSGSSPSLKPGGDVKITFKDAAGGTTFDLFAGILTSHAIRVRNGQSLLILEAKDKAVKMTIGEKNAYFADKKDSDIFSTLIGNASGASADVESTSYKHPFLFQHNSTDWDFMLRRAEAIGVLVTCKANTVSVKKPRFSGSAASELKYGNNVMEAELEIDGRTQLQGVEATAWDISSQAVVTTTKTAPGTTVPDNPGTWTGASLGSSFAPTTAERMHRGALEQTELDSWAEACMLKSRMARVRGRIKSYGFSIDPGDLVKLSGFGTEMSGNAYVTGVRQSLQGGRWTTHVQIGMSPEWHHQQYGQGTGPGEFYDSMTGLQPGLVTKLDSDPDSQYRIQVDLKFWGSSPPATVWARMAHPNAGGKRGLVWYPEVGDEVLLGFMHGDAAFPVILGSLFSSKAKSPVELTSDNNEMGIYTKNSIKMVFDDDKKALNIETPGGNKVNISDDAKSIEMQCQNGNKVTLDSSGITLKSAKDISLSASSGKIKLTAGMGGVSIAASGGDVKASGNNVSCEATMSFTGKGNTGATLQSTAITTVKGSLVQIN
ncbi:MAG: type VI secretion system tip protein VgrG [Bacteroidota bacterium]